VQIVLRNAELYRQIYEHVAPSRPALPKKLPRKPRGE
jgi:hypothetical protein